MELRWINRAIPIGFECGIVKKFLQYRTITNPLEHGLQPPIWSEWKDVPIVEKEE